MSWHTAALFLGRDLTADAPAFLTELGFTNVRLRGIADGDEAGSMELDGAALACRDGWTIVFNSPGLFGSGGQPDAEDPLFAGLWPASVEQALTRRSRDCHIFGLIAEGATGTYGYAWYSEGCRTRLCLYLRGQLRLDQGPLLDAEANIRARALFDQGLYDDAILQLAGELCPPCRDLGGDAVFQVYDYDGEPQ